MLMSRIVVESCWDAKGVIRRGRVRILEANRRYVRVMLLVATYYRISDVASWVRSSTLLPAAFNVVTYLLRAKEM